MTRFLLPMLAVAGVACGGSNDSDPPDGRPPDNPAPDAAPDFGTPPCLWFAFQSNLLTMEKFGKFYHRKKNMTEIRTITDLTVVRYQQDLLSADQGQDDYDWVLLDGSVGVLAFSAGKKKWDAVQSDRLKGATAVAALPGGKLPLLDERGALNLCFSYNGTTIVDEQACEPVAIDGRLLSRESDREVLVLTGDNEIIRVDTVDGSQTNVVAWPAIEDAKDLYANGEAMALIDQGGWRVRVAARAGNDYAPTYAVDGITLPIADMDGEASSYTTAVTGITRNKDGFFHVISRSTHQGVILYPDLKTWAPVVYGDLAAPFVEIKNEIGVAMYPPSGEVLYVAKDSFTILSESPVEFVMAEEFVTEELMEVFDLGMTFDPMDLLQYDDLLDLPGVSEALQDAAQLLDYVIE
jgi:hypothetical protein